jgi:hypothetical protein
MASTTETLISIVSDNTPMSSGLDSPLFCSVEDISLAVPAVVASSFGDLMSLEAPVVELTPPESTVLIEVDLLDSPASCTVECISPAVPAARTTSNPDLISFENLVVDVPLVSAVAVEVECARVSEDIRGLSTCSDIMVETSPVNATAEMKAEEVENPSPVEKSVDTPSSTTKSSVDVPKTSNASVGTSNDIPEWRRKSPTPVESMHSQNPSTTDNPSSSKRRYRKYSPPRKAANSSTTPLKVRNRNFKRRTPTAPPPEEEEDTILFGPQRPSPYNPDGTLKIIPPLESMHAPWNNPGNDKPDTSKGRYHKSSPPRKVLPTPPTTPPTTPPQVNDVKRSTLAEEPARTPVTDSATVLYAPEGAGDKVYGGYTNLRGDPEKLERLNQPSSPRGVLESRWAPH